MAEKHLVPCECGNQVAATINQAGSHVVCSCGRTVSIPPLRRLRQLPVAAEPAADAVSAWTARQAVAVGGTALVVGLLLWGGFLLATEPLVPTFDEQANSTGIQSMVDRGTPLQFWQHWLSIDQTLAEQGFKEFTSPQIESLKDYVADRILLRNVVLGMAGAVALLTAVAWFAWPQRRGPGGRPG